MEIHKIVPLPVSPQLKEKRDLEKKHKEEASKSFGDYLISITNVCFDKCINTDSVVLTKKEENCITEFFNKFGEAHHYAYRKFQYINNLTESDPLDRWKDFGDYFGVLEWVYKEDLTKITNNYKLN